MKYSDLYLRLREEQQNDADRIWSIRNWSVGLAAAVFSALFPILYQDEVADPAFLSNPLLVAFAVVYSAALMNGALWMMVYRVGLGTHRRGAYLWYLEHREDLSDGWEQWMFLRDLSGRPRWTDRFVPDVNTWIGFSWVIILPMFLWFGDGPPNFWSLLLIPIMIVVIGTISRGKTKELRIRMLRELLSAVQSAKGDFVRALTELDLDLDTSGILPQPILWPSSKDDPDCRD